MSFQQSLDIPARDDEDNKSQHSYRTMSSSRRQSTEDSIDTDDEYYCYEMRMLEEMERRSHMEQANRISAMDPNAATAYSSQIDEEVQQSLLSKIDKLTASDVGITEYNQGGEEDMMIMYYNNEADSYQPDDDVKKKMSVVLSELKKVVQPKVIDADTTIGAKVNRGNVYQKFGQVIDSSWQSQQQQPQKHQSQLKSMPFPPEHQRSQDSFNTNFMDELNQFEFEINNERQRRHSQQRNHFVNGANEYLPTAARTTNTVAAPTANNNKKVVRKKRQSRQHRAADDKSQYKINLKSIKLKNDEQTGDYSTSPYSSEDEQVKEDLHHGEYSSGATSGPDSPCHYIDDTHTQQQQQQHIQSDANSKNGFFVEATKQQKLEVETEQLMNTQQLQQYPINEQMNEMISSDGGRMELEQNNQDTITAITTQKISPNEENFIKTDDDDNIDQYIDIVDNDELEGDDSGKAIVTQSTTESIDNDTITTTDETADTTPSFKSKLNKMLSHESSQDSQNGGLGSSKWKLLKTLKEKKIEEKNNQEKIKEEENANKEKDSVSSVCSAR